MDDHRHRELMDNDEVQLTADETAQGWHFCPEWDGLLIVPGMTEMEACLCRSDADDHVLS